jgi:hypothetical protein
MCTECCCNDDRDREHELDVMEAKGQFHQVTMRVTIEATIDVPGPNHTTEDLQDFLGEVQENGEVVDWEEM